MGTSEIVRCRRNNSFTAPAVWRLSHEATDSFGLEKLYPTPEYPARIGFCEEITQVEAAVLIVSVLTRSCSRNSDSKDGLCYIEGQLTS
jgi:hypothetical protein